jgi:hypothetical protein
MTDPSDKSGPWAGALAKPGRVYTQPVDTFTDRERRLIARLTASTPNTTLQFNAPCPTHSVCTPLPLFRVHRDTADTFTAEWNTFHLRGPEQSFRFDEVLPAHSTR